MTQPPDDPARGSPTSLVVQYCALCGKQFRHDQISRFCSMLCAGLEYFLSKRDE